MKFELWDAPFAHEKDASAFLIAEPRGESTATVVVAPGGTDKYPKYLVEFTAVYAFSVEEEAGSLSFAGALTNRSVNEIGCSYVWQDSPIALEYSRLAPDIRFRGGRGPVVHYVFFGGDNAVGVVAAEEPRIQVVEAPTHLAVRHEI